MSSDIYIWSRWDKLNFQLKWHVFILTDNLFKSPLETSFNSENKWLHLLMIILDHDIFSFNSLFMKRKTIYKFYSYN